MKTLAKGIPASPGRAEGILVLTGEGVTGRGEPCVLLRSDTNADDGPGMRAAIALVATRGGITADAAIVARAMGKPCVVGCPSVHVDYAEKTVSFGGEDDRTVLREGDRIGVDGTAGELFAP